MRGHSTKKSSQRTRRRIPFVKLPGENVNKGRIDVCLPYSNRAMFRMRASTKGASGKMRAADKVPCLPGRKCDFASDWIL